MKRTGFTLVELMVAVAILSIVMAILFVLATTLGEASQVQEAKITTVDDARDGMLRLVRNLRQAAVMSINWPGLPGETLTFRAATDVDGNGTAVDVGVELELTGIRTLSRDLTDLNGDGLTVTQLIMEEGGQATVITNGLLPNEDANANDTLDAGEDLNFNGFLDRGLWFEPVGRAIRVTIQTQRASAAPQGIPITTTLFETVAPRN